MAKKDSAEFVQWIPDVLNALRKLGGTSTLKEVADRIATNRKLPDNVRFAKYAKTGNLKFPNQVAFARQYLFWEGLVLSPRRGIWSLSPAGQKADFTNENAKELVAKWVSIWAKRRNPDKEAGEPNDQFGESVVPDQIKTLSYKDEILQYLRRLKPSEFERFCGDLLRSVGMVRVEVLGGRGDKGIDGMGFLPSGPIVTIKVAFQCKRYNRTVSPEEIRAFRGAIGHRAEKGIFFTTDYFTKAAEEAAGEDMNKPIELVDGDRLVELLEQHQFCLRETRTYEVDWQIMDGYIPEDPKRDK